MRDTSLCAALEDRELAALHVSRSRHIMPAGYPMGDCGDLCANIVSGALKLSLHAKDGREQIVDLMFAGDFLGTPRVREQIVTATTLAQTEICAFSRHDFAHALDTFPPMRRMLVERAIAASERARGRLRMLGHSSARERVAVFILYITAHADGKPVRIPLRREEVANFLGLAAETVSRQLGHLRAEGVITLVNARDCTVLDHERLCAIARSPNF
ncbi:MAG: Crp/Fnr family transcriptional regulator [Candidatus Sphingomonas colombiensis]|nr:Crp/Fnr family transcriptional regulator [Sphingomonas sp.]WEK43150.1 MAG: Crp/Fnr family transcriptional regulator [Sphingomonas sp.]